MRIHGMIMYTLYLAGFLAVLWLAAGGLDYYLLPVQARPHSPAHHALKPAGSVGHGLGILGGSLMMLMFFYSARKRNVPGLRFGRIRYWLNLHILFGIMGPLFVTLHTAGKFGGIVSVSYWSMVLVMVSGFIGRYLYVQIPRATSGDELTLEQMEANNREMTEALERDFGLDTELLEEIRLLAGEGLSPGRGGIAALRRILQNDFSRRFRIRALRRKIRQNTPDLSPERLDALARLIGRKALLTRKIAMLSTIQRLLHHWHVAHKPFATVMLIVMLAHVAVAILFGYRWHF